LGGKRHLQPGGGHEDQNSEHPNGCSHGVVLGNDVAMFKIGSKR
jgi:hypothetical protein